MPYLNKDFKHEIAENGGTPFFSYMESIHKDENWAGAVNYINYTILKRRMSREQGRWSRYWRFALWVGTMICCVLEVYRRIIAPYENEKIEENGDA